MPYRYSLVSNDEEWVDEQDAESVVCAECGVIEWHEDVHWEDDTALCDYCYVNIFGEDN